MSCKLKAVYDHKQVRSTSSPFFTSTGQAMSGLTLRGPLNRAEAPCCSAGHPIAKCRRHRFRAFRTLFGGRGGEQEHTGTEIGFHYIHRQSKNCIRLSCFRHLMAVIYSLSIWKVQNGPNFQCLIGLSVLHGIVTEHENFEKVTALRATQ